MNSRNNPKLTGISQTLRKRMTSEERKLWYDFLKYLPVTFNRQKVIGTYVVDFYCASAKCVIELDGLQHFTENGSRRDEKRDVYFQREGIAVLRYSNEDVRKNFDGVCADIAKKLQERTGREVAKVF